jgi:hypothetical protein
LHVGPGADSGVDRSAKGFLTWQWVGRFPGPSEEHSDGDEMKTDIELLKLETEILEDRLQRLEEGARIDRKLLWAASALAMLSLLVTAQRGSRPLRRRRIH